MTKRKAFNICERNFSFIPSTRARRPTRDEEHKMVLQSFNLTSFHFHLLLLLSGLLLHKQQQQATRNERMERNISPLQLLLFPFARTDSRMLGWGNRLSSVDSSAPSILQSRVRIPSTPSFSIYSQLYYICHCIEDRTRISKKKPGLDHILKKNARQLDSYACRYVCK